jgi:hypothetical protein
MSVEATSPNYEKKRRASQSPPPCRLFPIGSPRSLVSTQSQEFDLMNEFGKRSLQKKIHELEKEIKYLGKSNER